MPDGVEVILKPEELKLLRKQVLGWSLKHLAKSSSVSVTQLCVFERGYGNLKPTQLRSCQRVLTRGLQDRGKQIAQLLSGQAAGERLAG
jgi:hypothetical protein